MALLPVPAAASPAGSNEHDILSSPGPFEGPEKLLEVWFAPSPDALPSSAVNGDSNGHGETSASGSGSGRKCREGAYKGLRRVPRAVWEEMLDIVKCKVLSTVEGDEVDAYLLRCVPLPSFLQSTRVLRTNADLNSSSESSLFVAPHLLILKTCGTTLNLLGLHRIIEIAREYCGFRTVWRCAHLYIPTVIGRKPHIVEDELTFLQMLLLAKELFLSRATTGRAQGLARRGQVSRQRLW